MATLNLSTNGPSISKSYQTVVNASLPTGPGSSPTYSQWAVFSVSTPLVSVFQQDAGNKESVLKVQSSGDGELAELIDEFSEGKVQFAYVKVRDPNTGLPKNVLIAWCGEGVPERTKGYFTSFLSAVSKFLHGYHVQITARSDGDLTPEGIVQKVADSSGSKYSSAAEPPVVTATPKPPTATKPVFTPVRTGGAGPNTTPRISRPAVANKDVGDDGWGPDAPPVTRTQLEKVQPAYTPTKVNMQELKSGRQAATENNAERTTQDTGDVVKGGYQPVGKVDIAAIRRQAREAGELKDDRPEPVKGAYEPVGKVDLAAIRARAQPSSDTTASVGANASDLTASRRANEPAATLHTSPAPSSSGRLTSLPKPKVSHRVAPSPAFTGTKPPLPTDVSKPTPAAAAAQVGSASRTFADEGGKTPAQLWAERKAREKGIGGAPIEQQGGNTDYSNTGKTWPPVQTAHTGASDAHEQDTESVQNAKAEIKTEVPQQSVSAIRGQFAQEASKPIVPETKPTDTQGTRPVPIPNLPAGPTEAEVDHEPETHQNVPSPPQQPRSPSPPSPPAREASPIRVAMPVGRGVTDAHDEQYSPPPAMPSESLHQAVPDEKDLDSTHDIGRAVAETAVGHGPQAGGGIKALVQYDYEKAEDNEIDLKEGEYVTDIEMVDKDWWLGMNAHGEKGLFPSNYVEVVEDDHLGEPAPETQDYGHETDIPETSADQFAPPPSAQDAAMKGPTATALYDYEAAEDN